MPPLGGKQSLRVLRIVTRLNIGGPAIHVSLLTQELPSFGYECLLAFGDCEDGEGDIKYLLRKEKAIRAVSSLSRSISPIRNLKSLFALWKIMRDERPLIVHTHTAMAGTLGRAAAFLAGIPIIIHTFHGNSLRHYFSPAVAKLFLGVERLLALRTDAICVISPQQLEELCEDLRVAPRSRFRVVPLGLDLSPFLRLSLPNPGNPIRVGWFGRFVDVKNIRLLIDTVSASRQSQHRFEFHVAGDGPDRHLLEAALPTLKSRLVWHGWTQDILPVLARCDLVMQTSRNEGTPVALIQGMAAGRPFVSTAAGGVVDMTTGASRIQTSGARWFDNSVLVEPAADAFARVLDKLAESPDQIPSMGQSARSFAVRNYRQEVLLSNMDALYQELIERKLPHLGSKQNAAKIQA